MDCTNLDAERRAYLLALAAHVAEVAREVKDRDRGLNMGQRAYLGMLLAACREVREEFGGWRK